MICLKLKLSTFRLKLGVIMGNDLAIQEHELIFRINEGDILYYQLFDEDGVAPIDVIGAKIILTVRKLYNSTENLLRKEATISGATGCFNFEISDTDLSVTKIPGNYYFDIAFKSSGGIREIVGYGNFILRDTPYKLAEDI